MIAGTSAYTNLHRKIRVIKGSARFCIVCWSPYRAQWANISGEYNLDPDDYKSLCPKHHGQFDTGRKRHFKRTPENRQKLSESMKGRIPWNKGATWSQEVRAKMKAAHKNRDITGSNNPNWRGGKS